MCAGVREMVGREAVELPVEAKPESTEASSPLDEDLEEVVLLSLRSSAAISKSMGLASLSGCVSGEMVRQGGERMLDVTAECVFWEERKGGWGSEEPR